MKITQAYIDSVYREPLGNGREIRINCPFCSDDKKHMYINLVRQVYHCFKCEVGGKVETYDEPNIELYHISAKKLDIENKTTDYTKPNIIKSLPLNYKLQNEQRVASKYLNNECYYLFNRGITENELIKYDIRASMEKSGPYKNCIIFPIYSKYKGIDHPAALEYFVCRKYDKSEPKYINAPWPKNDTMFITRQEAKLGVIVEGIFDALAIDRIDYPGIALLGKKATSQQLDRLVRINSNGYLIYLDDDALTHAIQLKLQLNSLGIAASIIRHRLDAADLYLENKQELKELISYAPTKKF